MLSASEVDVEYIRRAGVYSVEDLERPRTQSTQSNAKIEDCLNISVLTGQHECYCRCTVSHRSTQNGRMGIEPIIPPTSVPFLETTLVGPACHQREQADAFSL